MHLIGLIGTGVSPPRPSSITRLAWTVLVPSEHGMLRATYRRFAARLSGLASGLALAVRPAGLAEVSGAQGRVLKIVAAKRLETIFGCP